MFKKVLIIILNQHLKCFDQKNNLDKYVLIK